MAVAPNVDLDNMQLDTRNGLLAAIADLEKSGVQYTVTSGARSSGLQAKLYAAYQARGYTGLPAAPPGSSNHEKGTAVDISVPPAQRDAANQILAKHGFSWLGARDPVHYDFSGPSAIPGLGAMLSQRGATAPKTAAIPGLDAMLSAPARSKPTPAAAPIPGLDKMLAGAPKASAAPTAIPGLDAMLSGGGASLPSLGTPGNPRRSGGFPVTPTPEAAAALSYPRHGSTGGNAPLQTTLPAIEAEHQHLSQGAAPVEKASWGPIQRGINIVGSPISIMSHYGNEVEKQVSKRVAAGDSTAYIPGTPSFIGANIDAAKAIPWGKMLWNNIVGNTGEMPQPLKAIGEGAPDTGVGKLIAKHPVATTALDFLVSFPIMHGMGELQNAAVGKIGQGVRAGAEASGLAPAGRGLLNKVPEPVRRFAGVDPIGNAASEIVNKSLAGWSQPLRDAEQLAEDSRATSQKYLKAGVNLKTTSEYTNQPVNKFDALVADEMRAGTAASPHAQPQLDQRAADRAHIALDILRQPQRLENANTIRQGFREGNLARSMFRGQSAAAQAAADTEWTNAAKSVLGETGGKTPTLPGEKPLLSPQQRAAGPFQEPPIPASAETGHQALYEASLRQHEREIRNLIQQAKLPPDQLADLQWELKERGAQFAQRALDMGESPGIAKEVAALEQRDVLRSKLAAKDQAALDAMERDQQARQAAAAAQAAKEAAQAQREHIGEVIQQGKIEMSAADRARNERTAANIKAGRDQANFDAEVKRVEALHERVKESLLYSGYNDLGTSAQRAVSDQQRAAEIEQVHAEARSLGIDPADVHRIASGYSRILDTLGQHMVDMGLMKPEAYQALKGRYLPQLYLMTKGNPGDVDQFLKFLDTNGMLTPEVRAAAAERGLVSRSGSASGLRSFTQSRKLTDLSQMNDVELGRALVPEATPAALHGIEAQSRAAGLADAHAEIAKNPEWAVPAEKAPLGWKVVTQKGPLAGMAVHPAIAAAMHDATAPNEIREITTRLFGPKLGPVVTGFNQGMRKAMVLGPGTIANIIVGHGWFAHAEAEMSGTHFGPLEAASAYRELRALDRVGRSADPYLNEALNKTDLLSQPGVIPKSAKRVSGGVGLETPFQNRIGKIKGVGRGYANFTHDALAAGKFGLYKQLRKAGFSIDEAARRTRNATINYTRLPKPIRLADQGMIAPFITFLYRSIPLMGKMAVRRPDIFAHASGLHLNYYLDRMADALATSQGRQPTAVAARQSGAVGPVEFALPGSRDQQGHQRYAHAPLFAPLLHHFASGQDLADVIKHPVLNAAPLFQSLRGALVNQDVRNEEPRQIVPEGSLPPGSGMEKSVEIGKWLLRGIIPPAGGIERIINAERGTTLFPSRSLAPQTPGEAVLQFLTGTKIGTATQLQRSADTLPGATAPSGERQQEAMRVMKEGGGEKYGRIAVDHLKSLFNARSHDPNYTPNQSYSAAAQRLPDPKLREVIDTASKSLQGIIYGQKYTGADREAAIKRMVDWNYALVNELLRRRLPGAGHAVSGLARGAAMPLAQMRRQSP